MNLLLRLREVILLIVKFWVQFFSVFSVGMLWLEGTSAGLASDHCPICKKKSYFVELHSFSMFGEPSRDFLDSPIFHFGGPRICPWDLFASQSNDWEVEDQAEFVRLRTRLETKEPVILLTADEGKLLDKIRKGEESDSFLELRELWWMRTLRSPAGVEDEIMMTMKLFASCYGDSSPMPELREVYRRKLLELFETAVADQNLKEEPRFRYQYLHAEFVRKGGALEEAVREFSEFDKLLGGIPEKKRMEYEPLVTWTKEQILGLQLKTAGLDSLVKGLIVPLPNPFRDNESEEGDTWLRHRWALKELVQRCLDGDQAALDRLWELLGRDAGKLLAAAETVRFPSLNRFAKSGPRWEKWRLEMVEQLGEGKIPKEAEAKINQERNVNILSRIVLGDKFDPLPPLPAAQPQEADTPEKRLRAALATIEEGTNEEATKSVVKALDELRALDWQLAKEETMYDYPLQYFSRAFALSGDRFQTELEASLTKTWKDPFFREMARLWLGKPDALAKLEGTEALTTKPKYPGYGPVQMVYFFLEARKNPAWKARCVRDLKDLNMLNDRVYSYAEEIMTPELEMILLERHTRIMNFMKQETFKRDDWDWRPGEAADIESFWRNTQLAKIPLKVSE